MDFVTNCGTKDLNVGRNIIPETTSFATYCIVLDESLELAFFVALCFDKDIKVSQCRYFVKAYSVCVQCDQ